MIKDFILALIDAYKKLYADKLQAIEYIKELNKLKLHYSDTKTKLQNIEDYLKTIWNDLPIDQRKDYIQKTYDLIHYGFNVKYHKDGTRTYGGFRYGMISMYEYLIKLVERKIIECKNHYKHQEYPEIATIYNETKKKLNEELISYGILNSESNDISKTETVR